MYRYIKYSAGPVIFILLACFVILPCSAEEPVSMFSLCLPGSVSGNRYGVMATSSASTVTIQSSTDCAHCGKNIDLVMVNTSVPDTVYLIHLDSTGHAVRPGVWNGNYNFIFHQFMCSSVVMNNIPVLHDTTIAFNTTGTENPVTGVFVDDLTLHSYWFLPLKQEIYFLEKWASGSFTTNQWTTSGGNNWMISNGIGYPSPSAMFNWSPQCTNYDQYLTSPYLNAHHAPYVRLFYDVSLDNFMTTNVNSLAVEVWNRTGWNVVKTYDNQWGSFSWTCENLDITSLADTDFRIRFHAYGTDSYDINSWMVDNIKIKGFASGWQPPECFLGVNLYLNNVLSAFVNDTAYYIPPQQVIYGQPYQFCAKAVYGGGYSSPSCTTFVSKYLYPPRNFEVTPLECAAHLTWDKPDDSVARIACTGYNIYGNYTLLHHNNSVDSTSFDHLNLTPGHYSYRIFATYNLGIYGFSGQTGQSLPIGNWQNPVIIHCGFPMPFLENFQQGSFGFHDWSFEPDQGNWGITTYEKSTSPYADFSWNPVRYNYSYAMVSDYIDAYSWPCASVWLDLDYRLADRNSTGNEKLKIEAWYGDTWHLLKELSNNGSVDWTTLHLDLSAAAGKTFKIRFVACGNNSGDIFHWNIDNIHAYGICAPPSGLTASVSGHQAELSWNSPPCIGSATADGYNVYRTGPGGVPPFVLRNQALVHGTTYVDDIDPNSTYFYYITAVSIDSLMNEPVCESAGSDTAVVSTVAVHEKKNRGPGVYPNPAAGSVHVVSDQKIESINILDHRGRVIASIAKPDTFSITLDISAYPSGIYFFRVTDHLTTRTLKVIITH